jgi:hypothetical protein
VIVADLHCHDALPHLHYGILCGKCGDHLWRYCTTDRVQCHVIHLEFSTTGINCPPQSPMVVIGLREDEIVGQTYRRNLLHNSLDDELPAARHPPLWRAPPTWHIMDLDCFQPLLPWWLQQALMPIVSKISDKLSPAITRFTQEVLQNRGRFKQLVQERVGAALTNHIFCTSFIYENEIQGTNLVHAAGPDDVSYSPAAP